MSYELCGMNFTYSIVTYTFFGIYEPMSFFLYIIYKALFFCKKAISGPIFIKFSPLKFKIKIVSYSNFEQYSNFRFFKTVRLYTVNM